MSKATTQASSKKTKTAASVSPAQASSAPTRKLKKPQYQSFKLQKRIKPDHKLPGAFRLLRTALGTLRRNWKLFVGITLVYGVLNIILVQGFNAAADLSATKASLDEAFSGSFGGALASGATLFVYLLGTSGASVNPTSGAYQFILTLGTSLALIWALRQVYAAVKIRIRDSFYSGMYPLVPFLLVLLVIAMQLIPLIIGAFLYNTVTANDIAVGAVERVLWGTVLFSLGLVSLYMVCSSVFALYIVSLPDMTPMRALRSARQLVLGRRWTVIRKVVFLPLSLLILGAALVIPFILFATPLAPWVFLLLSMGLLAIIHSYMYALYRSLL